MVHQGAAVDKAIFSLGGDFTILLSNIIGLLKSLLTFVATTNK